MLKYPKSLKLHKRARPVLPAVAALFLGLLAMPADGLAASLRLPAVFGDHMVLQSGTGAAIWGWGEPGQSVKIEFRSAGKTEGGTTCATATVAPDGRWRATLPPIEAGARGRLVVASASEWLVRDDVLAGEVWLASGQSNMTFSVARSDQRAEAGAAAVGDIRVFTVAQNPAPAPLDDVTGQWVEAAPGTVGRFSAVAWFFASALHRELGRPVGMVVSAWGGTPIETWLSPEVMKNFPEDARHWQAVYDKKVADQPALEKKYQQQLAAWEAKNPTPDLQRKNAAAKPRLDGPRVQNTASRCHNGMIRGLAPFTFRGILWYQGESNSGRPDAYVPLIKALVTSWRAEFASPALPFHYVELPNYNAPGNANQDGGWARIRESLSTVLALPGTGVACAIDLGDPKDIHPTNKLPVGERLADTVLAGVYGLPGLRKSPQYAGHAVEGATIRVRLDYAGGLRVRAGAAAPESFEIRGADGRWSVARARIENDQIVLWGENVPAPAAARHAWSSNPRVTVENRAGLPLRPFRTDFQP
jgi:sialate O-acetylesterase